MWYFIPGIGITESLADMGFVAGAIHCPEYPNLPPEVQTLEFKRIRRAEFEAAMERGYTEGNITWGLADRDLASYNNGLTLIELARIPDTSMFHIVDISGASHDMTVAAYKALVLKIGLYVADLRKKRDL